MVKIALKDVVPSKGLLVAHHVAQGFKSNGGLSGRRCNKKGKGKVENWRQRPLHSGVFQRTLPGELSCAIIVARKVPSAATGNSEDSCCPEGLSDCEVQKKRTLMTVNAARTIIREMEGLDVDLLCAKTRTWNRANAARKPSRKHNVRQFLYFYCTHCFHWQATPKLQL